MTPTHHGWHPVARSEDLRAGLDIVAACAAGQALALWRTADGAAQAWDDRCPHRSVRLTLGQVLGDRLSCAYHGWQWAADSGLCAGIPAHPAMPAPRNVRARTFRVAEAAGVVWTRLDGDAAAPPPPAAVPPGWHPLRTLAIRAGAAAVADALARHGWQPDGAAWRGALGDTAACALLLDAQPRLAMLHLWSDVAPATGGIARATGGIARATGDIVPAADAIARAHAAARRLRADIEAAAALEAGT